MHVGAAHDATTRTRSSTRAGQAAPRKAHRLCPCAPRPAIGGGKQALRPRIGFVAAAPELLGIVNVGIEHAGQCELAASVDGASPGLDGNSLLLPTATMRPSWMTSAPSRMMRRVRIDRDQIIDVDNDKARHRRGRCLAFLSGKRAPTQYQRQAIYKRCTWFPESRPEAARRTMKSAPRSV